MKGCVVGGEGNIFITSDGGNEWIEINSGTNYGLRSVFFIDENKGWAVGYQGTILNTVNGGLTWFNQISGTDRDLFSVFFVNENEGRIVGESGFMLTTTDGGINWLEQTKRTPYQLYSTYFISEDVGWATGTAGIILKTTNGGISFVEEEEIDEIPTDYNLSHNYPNPFNPSTKIKYSVSLRSNVVVKVFDILGNEIETLVNEEKQTGTYEITWYAESLPSGIYFYRLQAGNFVETKKMVLMK